jgi:Protoglobin
MQMQSIVDWPARLKEMAQFVGLGDDDLALVQATAPLLLPHADELTSAIYNHFLKFPRARQFFLTNDGEVDQERLARRKHSLTRWLRASGDFKVDEQFPVFLLAIGLVHSHPPTNRAHLGSVPSRYMTGTISFAQTALSQLLLHEMNDPHQAIRASIAWNKLLMVQLDILLAGYITELPIEPETEDEGR